MTERAQLGTVIRAQYLAQDAAFSEALFELYGGHPQWPNVMRPDGSVLPVTPPDDDDDAPVVEEPLPPMEPMTEAGELLHEVRAYLDKWDMSPSAFGERAVGTHMFVRRLERGARIRAETIAKARLFMAKPPAEGSWQRLSSKPEVVTQKQMDASFDVRAMVREVAKHFGEKPEVVASTAKSSKHHVVLPKQVLAWRLVRERKWSTPRVGMLMGRDHTNVVYAVRKVEELIATDRLRLPKAWGGRRATEVSE